MADLAGIWRLPKIRMAPPISKEEETGGQAQMVTLLEDHMGDMESLAKTTRRNGRPRS